jgi:hypothetical protein
MLLFDPMASSWSSAIAEASLHSAAAVRQILSHGVAPRHFPLHIIRFSNSFRYQRIG